MLESNWEDPRSNDLARKPFNFLTKFHFQWSISFVPNTEFFRIAINSHIFVVFDGIVHAEVDGIAIKHIV